MKGNIRRRKAGVWEINWETNRDENGKRHRRSATVRGTKDKAKERLAQKIAEVDRQRSEATNADPEELLVEDWLWTWHKTSS